jgi:hypothetical protein
MHLPHYAVVSILIIGRSVGRSIDQGVWYEFVDRHVELKDWQSRRVRVAFGWWARVARVCGSTAAPSRAAMAMDTPLPLSPHRLTYSGLRT